jgi:hypothetical protein
MHDQEGACAKPQVSALNRPACAEGQGFEPWRNITAPSGFQDRRHRPLGEPSRRSLRGTIRAHSLPDSPKPATHRHRTDHGAAVIAVAVIVPSAVVGPVTATFVPTVSWLTFVAEPTETWVVAPVRTVSTSSLANWM